MDDPEITGADGADPQGHEHGDAEPPRTRPAPGPDKAAPRRTTAVVVGCAYCGESISLVAHRNVVGACGACPNCGTVMVLTGGRLRIENPPPTPDSRRAC